ncbi:MAG: sulfotransferase domain-containing protein [Rhodopirellula sp. JB053]
MEYRRQPPLNLIVGSAHKVGSTWLFQMLETLLQPQYDFEGLLIPGELKTHGFTDTFDVNKAATFVSGLRGRWLFKTHRNVLPTVRDCCQLISVHRDLRDACVSMVHFGTGLKAKSGGYPDEIKKLPFEEKLHYEIDRSYNLERAEYWWNCDCLIKVRYEQLKRDSADVLRTILQATNLSDQYSTDAILAVSNRHDFENVARRKVGHEDKNSFLRKGIVGDWRNVFDDSHIEHFKQAHDGRWNQLLVKMGYESALNWHATGASQRTTAGE